VSMKVARSSLLSTAGGTHFPHPVISACFMVILQSLDADQFDLLMPKCQRVNYFEIDSAKAFLVI
jgi:hypothetical protein